MLKTLLIVFIFNVRIKKENYTKFDNLKKEIRTLI